MLTFINPKTDFAFKKIFGSAQSKDILISFLNAILYDAKPTIQDLTILDPYQAPRIVGMKDSFLDIKAKLADSTTVIIEMQVLNTFGFEKRVLYNAAKSYSTQLKQGDNYHLLNPVIALTVTDFDMFEHNSSVISRYCLMDKTTFTEYSDDIELVFVELPKFKKELEALETLSDKWLFFLKSADELQAVPSALDEVSEIHDAFEVARQSKLTPEEMEIFEKRQMALHDYRNAILKGRIEGKKEGKIELARALLDVLPIATISQKSGLSIEEINALKQEGE
ncbi:MAG: Rpn family recombination-promoting nuclease/putative transposase [Cyanobacteria bacterium P01_D01_bin.36]